MTSLQRFREAISSRRPGEPPAPWLGRTLDLLPADAEMDDAVLDTLVRQVNGPLADEQRSIEQDPAAYVAFWRSLADRLPTHPLARATYADTLLLTGDTDDALSEMLSAFEADPKLIYRMSGEYRDLMERAGGRDWAAYRALAVKAAELDDPDLHGDYVRDELRGLLADIGDQPELIAEVLRILRPDSR